MYKITVLTRGRDNGTVLGPRYALRRKEAQELVNLFHEFGCTYKVEKFIRLFRGVYSWSESVALDYIDTCFVDD